MAWFGKTFFLLPKPVQELLKEKEADLPNKLLEMMNSVSFPSLGLGPQGERKGRTAAEEERKGSPLLDAADVCWVDSVTVDGDLGPISQFVELQRVRALFETPTESECPADRRTSAQYRSSPWMAVDETRLMVEKLYGALVYLSNVTDEAGYKLCDDLNKVVIPWLFDLICNIELLCFATDVWGACAAIFKQLVGRMMGKHRRPPEWLVLPVEPLWKLVEYCVFNEDHLLNLAIPLSHLVDTLTARLPGVLSTARFAFPPSALQFLWMNAKAHMSPGNVGLTVKRFAVVAAMIPCRLDAQDPVLHELLAFVRVSRVWADYAYLYQFHVISCIALIARSLREEIDWLPYLEDIFTVLHQSFRLPIGSKEEARTGKSLTPDTAQSMVASVDLVRLHRHLASSITWILPPDHTAPAWDKLRYFIRCVDSHIRPGARVTTGSEHLCSFLDEMTTEFVSRMRAQVDREKTGVHPEFFLPETAEAAFVKLLLPILDLIFLKGGNRARSAMNSISNFAAISPKTLMEPLNRRISMGLMASTEPHQISASLEVLLACMYKLSLNPEVRPALVSMVRNSTTYIHDCIDINDPKKTAAALGAVFHLACSFGWQQQLYTSTQKEWATMILGSCFKFVEACTTDQTALQAALFTGLQPLFANCTEETLDVCADLVLENTMARRNPKMFSAFRGITEAIVSMHPRALEKLVPPLVERVLKCESDDSLHWYGVILSSVVVWPSPNYETYLPHVEECVDKLLAPGKHMSKMRTKIGGKIIRNVIQALTNMCPADFSPWNPRKDRKNTVTNEGEEPIQEETGTETGASTASPKSESEETDAPLRVSTFDAKSVRIDWFIPSLDMVQTADRLVSKYCKQAMHTILHAEEVLKEVLEAESDEQTSSVEQSDAQKQEQEQGSTSPPPKPQTPTTGTADRDGDELTAPLLVKRALYVLRYVTPAARPLLAAEGAKSLNAHLTEEDYNTYWWYPSLTFLWPYAAAASRAKKENEGQGEGDEAPIPKQYPRIDGALTFDDIYNFLVVALPQLPEEMLDIKSLKITEKVIRCLLGSKGGIGSVRLTSSASVMSAMQQSILKTSKRKAPRFYWVMTAYARLCTRLRVACTITVLTRLQSKQRLDFAYKLSLHRFSQVRMSGQYIFHTELSRLTIARRAEAVRRIVDALSTIDNPEVDDHVVTGILHLLKLQYVRGGMLELEEDLERTVKAVLTLKRLKRDSNEQRKADILGLLANTLYVKQLSAVKAKRIVKVLLEECIELSSDGMQYNSVLASRMLPFVHAVITLISPLSSFPMEHLPLLIRMGNDSHTVVNDMALLVIFTLTMHVVPFPMQQRVAYDISAPPSFCAAGDYEANNIGHLFPPKTYVTTVPNKFETLSDLQVEESQQLVASMRKTLLETNWLEEVIKVVLAGQRGNSQAVRARSWLWYGFAAAYGREEVSKVLGEQGKKLVMESTNKQTSEQVVTEHTLAAELTVAALGALSELEDHTALYAAAEEFVELTMYIAKKGVGESFSAWRTMARLPLLWHLPPKAIQLIMRRFLEQTTLLFKEGGNTQPLTSMLKLLVSLLHVIPLWGYRTIAADILQFSQTTLKPLLLHHLTQVRSYAATVAASIVLVGYKCADLPPPLKEPLTPTLKHLHLEPSGAMCETDMTLKSGESVVEAMNTLMDELIITARTATAPSPPSAAGQSGVAAQPGAGIPQLHLPPSTITGASSGSPSSKSGTSGPSPTNLMLSPTDVESEELERTPPLRARMAGTSTPTPTTTPTTAPVPLAGEEPTEEMKTLAKCWLTFISSPHRTNPALHRPFSCGRIVTSFLYACDLNLPKDQDESVAHAMRTMGFGMVCRESSAACMESIIDLLGTTPSKIRTRKGKIAAISLLRIYFYFNAMSFGNIKENPLVDKVVDVALKMMEYPDRRVKDEGAVLFSVVVRLLRGEQLTLLIRRCVTLGGAPVVAVSRNALLEQQQQPTAVGRLGESPSTPPYSKPTLSAISYSPFLHAQGAGTPVAGVSEEQKRVSAIYALCAALSAFPDTVPSYAPVVMTKLAGFTRDRNPDITEIIRDTLAAWWKAHRDMWEFEHKQYFSDAQLDILMELFRSPSYYV